MMGRKRACVYWMSHCKHPAALRVRSRKSSQRQYFCNLMSFKKYPGPFRCHLPDGNAGWEGVPLCRGHRHHPAPCRRGPVWPQQGGTFHFPTAFSPKAKGKLSFFCRQLSGEAFPRHQAPARPRITRCIYGRGGFELRFRL